MLALVATSPTTKSRQPVQPPGARPVRDRPGFPPDQQFRQEPVGLAPGGEDVGVAASPSTSLIAPSRASATKG